MTLALITISKGNPFSGGVKYTGVGKLANFHGNRRLSRKRYEVGRLLLWNVTRSSADADNRLDAVFTIFVFKKFPDLEMGVKGHSRSLRVVSFDRLCMVSY